MGVKGKLKLIKKTNAKHKIASDLLKFSVLKYRSLRITASGVSCKDPTDASLCISKPHSSPGAVSKRNASKKKQKKTVLYGFLFLFFNH